MPRCRWLIIGPTVFEGSELTPWLCTPRAVAPASIAWKLLFHPGDVLPIREGDR